MKGSKNIYLFSFFILFLTVLFAILLPNLPGYMGETETNVLYFSAFVLFIFVIVGLIWGHK